MRRYFLVTLVLVVTVGVGRSQNVVDHPPPADRELVEHLTAPDPAPLVSYRARRHLTATTQGGKLTGSIDVITALDGHQFTWAVLEERGSSIIRNRVLRAALQAEADSQSDEVRAQAALTEANYEFFAMNGLTPETRRLALHPRRKHMMLVSGHATLNAHSGELLSVEGELAKRPSFWTRRVHVIRSYNRVAGVHVPVEMRSTADVLVVGKSTFDMTYDYLEINGKQVGEP